MQHADPDQLALLALGEPLDGIGAEVAAHLQQCPLCRNEVEVLRRTVELARESVEYRGDAARPPEAVWSRIAADLDLAATPPDQGHDVVAGGSQRPAHTGTETPASDEAGTGPATPVAGTGPARGAAREFEPVGGHRSGTNQPGGMPVRGIGDGAPRHRTGGHRRWLRPAAALAAAVAVGVVGTLAVVRPWQEDASVPAIAGSTASLGPVAGGPIGASGRAVVVQRPSGPELDVTAAGLPLQRGYYEVWVFDGDRTMVSVGALGADSRASLPLPPTLDLRTFHVVDISQEQYDGDQTHSKFSVLRGTLTG